MLTKAIAGIARSGVTRSGYPVLLGAKVRLYALSNVARSGATRSNYTSARPFIGIDGIQRAGAGVIADSLVKSDQISGTADTLTFTAYGWVPVEGSDVIVTIGSINNDRREFGGTILSTVHRYAGKPTARNMLFDVACIDYTWGLNRYKVSGNYTGTTVAAVAAALMTWAPTYTLLVDPDIGAERLDQITFTEQGLSNALEQLVKRVGGEYLCDYRKQVHLFFENTAITAPTIINAVHASLQTIQWTRDLSQVATRVLGSFGGSDALDAIAPGATLLPVQTAAWYLPQGGRVLVGQQRVQYAGIVGAGGGSLVGPGASPTGAPNASLLPGAGVDVGSHDYAVTYKTASGESVPGPRLTVPVGVFLPPATAPTAGAPTAGPSGPDHGVHDYAVAFVISTGETAPGPRMAASTAILDAPTAAPNPDRVDSGPGPDPGPHDYACSFLPEGGGETLAGPIGGQITTGGILAPTNAPNPGSVTVGPGPEPGPHNYVSTFVRPEGETDSSPWSPTVTTGLVAPPATAPQGTPAAGGNVDAGPHQYACTFVRGGDTTPGPLSASVTTGGFGPPASAPTSSPYCQQYPSEGNYSPGTNSGNVGDAVSYALAYANDGVNYSDLSNIGPGSGAVVIQRTAFSGFPNNCCRRTVTLPGVSGVSSYRLYVSVNGGGWACLTFGSTSQNPVTMEVAGTPANFGYYPGPGHGPIAKTIKLVNLPIGDATVTARKLYRQSGGAGLKLLATISDNTTTTYTDATPNASLGAAPPSVNGTLAATVHLSGIQTAAAGAGVIARKLYRYSAGTWGLVTTINDNTTTSYLDTTPNANRGAWPPSANGTTGGNQTVHLANIPTAPSAAGNAWRALYRRSAGAGLRFVAYIQDNTTRTYSDTTPNASLGAAAPAGSTAILRQIPLTKIPIGNSLVLARKVYRTPANTGGGILKLVATIADNTTTDLLDTVADASLGAAALTVGTAQAAQVQLSAIPLGAAAVIARVLYRTKAGLSQLQTLVTLGDNVTTAYLDVLADAALGANAPIADNSLLQQPTGNVQVGSPTLPCATVAAFRPAGGWAIVGSQNIRYTGISGNALLGIPPSGPGAITATITWNTTVVAAAMLTGIPANGIGAIKYQILKGDAVNIFVQVDDPAAQAAVRAQLTNSDGIIEDEISDGRLSYIEGLARCQARLDLLGALDSDGKVGVIAVSYVCRDLNTQAGAMVTVNLGPPINLRGDFRIQRVNVSRFNVPHLHPAYTVEASSLRFSAEEMLRLLRQGAF
jgi:hypothetical protein